MADEPLIEPQPPTPAPAPEPAVAPAAPPPTPAAPAAADLTPDTMISFPDQDGNPQYASLADLVAAKNSPQANLDPKELERLQMLDAGLSGNDPEATRKLLDSFAPPPAKPADPASELTQLRETVGTIQERLQQVEGTTTAVDALRKDQAMGMIISQQKQHLPYLSKHPQAAQYANRQLEHAKASLLGAGQNPEKLPTPQAQQLLVHALKTAEAELAGIAQVYAGFAPAAPPQGEQVVVNDDQRAPGDPADGRIPARLQMVNGQLVNMAGHRVAQDATGRANVLPADVPNAAALGSHVQGTEPPSPAGPLNRKSLVELLNQKIAAR